VKNPELYNLLQELWTDLQDVQVLRLRAVLGLSLAAVCMPSYAFDERLSRVLKNSRRSRVGGSPENRVHTESTTYWIPAFAGMTIFVSAARFSTGC
jgi:hypothetical protein